MGATIKTDKFSRILRQKSVKLPERKLLISNFKGTGQAGDLSVPPNCNGFGRIRHFHRDGGTDWVANPLPIDPACRALGLGSGELLRAQVFQNASCNWRCWYCYVPFDMLDARESLGAWLSADELVELYLAEADRPQMIDLTGGQPELIPEWVPWTMQALQATARLARASGYALSPSIPFREERQPTQAAPLLRELPVGTRRTHRGGASAHRASDLEVLPATPARTVRTASTR